MAPPLITFLLPAAGAPHLRRSTHLPNPFAQPSRISRPLARRPRPRPPICKSAVPSTTTAPPLPAVPSTPFRTCRLGIFLAMVTTYASYVALRSTFPMASPVLGLPLQAIGTVNSAFPAAYGLSRLLTGAIVDNGSPRTVLLTGLSLAGLCVALMSIAPVSAVPLAALWGLHGLVQGAGAGASAKLLTSWFAPRERGRWWALWATSANAGAFFGPLAVSALAGTHGARIALLVPGCTALVVAAAAATVLSDTPAAAGYRADWAVGPLREQDDGQKKRSTGFWTAVAKDVMRNKALWALAGAYFCVYLVRTGLKNWLHFYLIASRGIAPAQAALRASVAELGGVAGTFGAGILSDLTGGRRAAVTVVYLVMLAGCIGVLALLPAGCAAADAAVIATLGCAVNGPQMMIGLIGAEVCDPRVMATAAGLLGCISYFGAAAAGYPLARVAQAGWGPFFAVLVGATVVAAALLGPFWGLTAAKEGERGREGRRDEKVDQNFEI